MHIRCQIKQTLPPPRFFVVTIVVLSLLLLSETKSPPVFAYSTNMDASVVLGQPGFTSNTANNGGISASTLINPRGVTICDGKLVVADNGNSRVLIWNAIPTSNTVPADVVIGQPDFESNTANNGGRNASTLNGPWGVNCHAGKLYIADMGNNRLLIYNSIPTTNGASADVVVGQADFTSAVATGSGHSATAHGLDTPGGSITDGTRLVILDTGSQRALIYNTIPTTNGVSADLAIGAPTTTQANNEGCAANRLSGQSLGIHFDGQKLFIGTTFPSGAYRVLIWNAIPTTNYADADVVVGQPDFSTCVYNNGGRGANTLADPFGVFTDSAGRLLVADRSNQRILIFNSVPTVNGASADFAIGQPSFTDGSANQGQPSPAANTLNGARFVTAADNKIIVSDGDNNRILIFDDNLPSASNVRRTSTTNTNTPTLAWDFDDADTVDTQGCFQVQVDSSSSFNSSNFFDSGKICASDTSFNVAQQLTDGNWFSRIQLTDSQNSLGAFSTPFAFTIDTTAPSGHISINNGGEKTSSREVTLTLNATDVLASVTEMMISNTSDFSNSSWESYATTRHWTLSVGNGEKTVYVKFRDEAGNVSDVYTAAIQFDTPPTVLRLEKIGTVATIDGITTYYYTTGKNLTFKGTTSPNATVVVKIESDPVTCTTEADNEGNWECRFDEEIPVGYHTVTVTAYYPGSSVLSTEEYKLGIGVGLAQTGNPAVVSVLVGAMMIVGGTAVTLRRKKHQTFV